MRFGKGLGRSLGGTGRRTGRRRRLRRLLAEERRDTSPPLPRLPLSRLLSSLLSTLTSTFPAGHLVSAALVIIDKLSGLADVASPEVEGGRVRGGVEKSGHGGG